LRDGDLIDHKGRIVCKQSNFPHLSNQPWYPKHALDFIWHYLSAWLKNRNPYFKSEDWERAVLAKYFTGGVFVNLDDPDDEAVNACIERLGQVRQLLDPLLHLLEQKIAANRWLMFDVEQSYFDVVVRQQGDIRAYLWTKQAIEQTGQDEDPR
jgi:hypothetical protein